MLLTSRSILYPEAQLGLEHEFLAEMRERLVKTFLDMLILLRLRKHPMSGDDVINSTAYRFSFTIDPGMIYSTLHHLEKKGFIKSSETPKGQVYHLTADGRDRINIFLESKAKILGLVLDLFIGQ